MLVSTLAAAAPSTLTYQGRILKADGSPLEYSSVSFIFQVTDPSGGCVIYQEQVDGYNMANSGGVFDVPIGSGTVNFPSSGSFTVLDAFNNSATLNCLGGTSTYTPVNSDGRLLRVQFYDGSGWRLISPDNVIRSVPFAGYAASAQKLGTNTATDFVLKAGVNSGATCDSGSFLTWNAATQSFGCAAVSGASGGTVTNVSSANTYLSVANGSAAPVLTVNVGQVANTLAAGDDSRITNALQSGASAGGDLAGTYPNPSVAKILNVGLSFSSLTSGQFLKYNGTNWVNTNIAQSDVSGLSATLSGYMTTSAFNTAVASAGCSTSQTLYWNSVSSDFACQSISVAGFTGSLAGDVSGTQGATSVDKIKGVGVDFSTAPTSGQVLKYNGSNWAPAADNDAGASASSANTANTIVKRDASGNFTAGTITANLTGAASANVLKTGDSMSGNLSFANTKGTVFTDTGSNTATITGPSSAIGTSYVLRLPTAQGSANQALVNDGSGNLSWQSLSTGSVTSVSASAPLSSTGGATPTISIAQASSTTNGYLSSTDWSTFNSKLGTASSFSGDVSGTSSTTSVDKLKGTSLSISSLSSGNYLKYNGSAWVNVTPSSADLSDASSLIKSSQMPANCAAGQTLTFSSPTGSWTCSNIVVTASNFGSQTQNTFLAAPNGSSGTPTFRTIASADLPAGTLSGSGTTGYVPYYSGSATLANSAIYQSGGNVGIGTTTTGSPLTVNGTIESTSGGIKFPDGTTQTTAASNYGYQVKLGSFTAPGVTGNYSIAGLGFKPMAVKFWIQQYRSGAMPAVSTSVCTGTMTVTDQQSIFTYTNTGGANTARNYVFTDRVIACSSIDATDIAIQATRVSMDADGFTLNFTATSSSFTIIYEASGGSTAASAGSGSAGYVPVWNSSTNLGSSPIAVAGGNVGIGTTNPGAALDIYGGIKQNGSQIGGISGVPTFKAAQGSTSSGWPGVPTSGYSVFTIAKVFDVTGSYNGSTGLFTAPIAGYYEFSFSVSEVEPASGSSAGGDIALVYNGSANESIFPVQVNRNTTGIWINWSYSSDIYLNVGDTVSLARVCCSSDTGSTGSWRGSFSGHYLHP